ncbi:MAG: hypothetical protein R6U89_11750 [Dehalococcoidia bacterium]
MSYANIDPLIQKWADKYHLRIAREYKEYEVRTTDVIDKGGKKYQIWIDTPDNKGNISVHAWDYKKRRVDFMTTTSDLHNALESAYGVVLSWISQAQGK